MDKMKLVGVFVYVGFLITCVNVKSSALTLIVHNQK